MSENKMIKSLADLVELVLKWCCLGLMALIIAAMSAQIFFRFVLNAPLTNTDEIAQIALTWLTFLGAAWIYRNYGHITVDLLNLSSPASIVAAALKVFGELVVGVILVTLLILVAEAAPLALKLRPGTLELSRFFMHFLPLVIGCVGILVFVIEHVWTTLAALGVDRQRALRG